MTMDKRLQVFTKEDIEQIKEWGLIVDAVNNAKTEEEMDAVKDTYPSIFSDRRVCSECKSAMVEGYCIEGDQAYYCSETCLHKHYTEKEYEDLYEEGGETYYTSWANY